MLGRSRQTRPLTKADIEALEQALGRRVDRGYLARWVSESIEDAVRSVSYPTPRQLRDRLRDVERHGRQFLGSMDEPNVARFLCARTNLAKFRAATVQFCDQTSALVEKLDALVRPGRSRTPAVLEAFVDRMIGIAKKAKVLPSTPSRRENRKRAETPAFFRFLRTALRIARQVIQTSELSENVKRAAASKLQYQTPDALIKVVIRVRGKISRYKDTPYGLVESDTIARAGE